MTAKKVTAKTVTVKPVITISAETATLLISAVMKLKLWATPGEIKYVRSFNSAKEMLIITAVKVNDG